MCAFPAASSPPPQKLPFCCIFFSWAFWWTADRFQICAFTASHSQVADLGKKNKTKTNRRWTLFEYLKLKHNIFHLTSLLSAGGSLEISLKWRPHPDYPETWKRSSFYPPHLFWALLHGAIICSSQFSPQTGFGDKLLGQDRKYCFMRCVLATECLWPL